MAHDLEYLKRSFRHFAEVCDGYSPLYATLAARAAEDERVLSLASGGQPRQPPNNLLFAAVQYLLLSGVEHPLAGFYPSVGGDLPSDDAYPAFASFCREHEKRIVELVATRRVQTNEVGRCGLLLPAFALAQQHFDGRPLYLIDVGSSAGLNLLFDRYRYEYYDGRSDSTVDQSDYSHAPDFFGRLPVQVCGPESRACIRTELQGDAGCPLPKSMPTIAERVGLDIAPVDVTDDSAVRWVAALIWPDQLHRVELFRDAVALARAEPPHVIAGDAMRVVPGLVKSAPPDVLPCVFHSHATCQMSNEWRERFAALLADLGRTRELVHISLEWLKDDPGPRLHLTTCTGGERRTTLLAECHHHGVWIRWIGA